MLREYNTTDFKHIIEWRIEKFSSCAVLKGKKMECPASIAGNLFNTSWVFLIYPKGKPDGDPSFLGCFIKRDVENNNAGPEKLHIEFEISVVTSKGVPTFKKSGSSEFKRGDSYGYPSFVKLEEIFRLNKFLLQSDTLILRCKLRLLPTEEKQVYLQTFVSWFPVERISRYMPLDNFQEISRQNPEVLHVRDTKDLLLLEVSMNKDEALEDRIAEEAVGNRDSGFPESYLHMVMVKKEWNQRVHVSCCIKLLDKNLKIAIEKEITHLFTQVKEKEKWVLPHLIDTNNLGDDCIDNGKLRLHFVFTVCLDKPISLERGEFTPLIFEEDPREKTLMKDMVVVYETVKFSDITLRIGDKTFPAHKSILAARSPKFDEIFTRLMKESANCENRVVEIGDVDKDTMTLMLKYIYTDELEDLDEVKSLLLYSAAQKYQISSLQFKCARTFRENLDVETVYRVEKFKDSGLKIAALDCIANHYPDVLLGPGWKAFTEEHEELFNQVMRHIRQGNSN